MSSNTINIFTEKVIKNKIKAPTRADFSLDKWEKEWEKIASTASERDKTVYTTGIIINSLLNEVREKLAANYQRAPKTSYEKLLLSYVAISNRTTSVALKLAMNSQVSNAQSILLKSSIAGNELGLGEIFHGAVDGVQLAIRECISNMEKGNKITTSIQPIEEMSFIQQEHMLSQLYWTYTHFWQCIIWSNYELIEVDRDAKHFIIKQPNNKYETAFLTSANRKERIAGQSVITAREKRVQALFKNDKYIVIRKENKKRTAVTLPILNADEGLLISNTLWRLRENELKSYLPEPWLNDNFGQDFCLTEALEVMRCLMLMAYDTSHKYPDDDSAQNVNKLREFCPTVQATSLERALCDATGIEAHKISKITEFLTSKSSPTNDLWCQPLIKVSNNKFAIIVSALTSPVLLRIVEHWVDTFKIDLGEKGYIYEKKIIEKFNNSLKGNQLILDYNDAISKRMKINGSEEEIDLLARIDDMIIIGEAKSIVTTDSAISKYRTSEVLQHAGEQIVRKTKFLEENLEAIFERLNWQYDTNKKYNIVQCILNSSSIFVGHEFEGIPVIDEKILCSYFTSNKMRLMTVASQNELKTIAWYKLYDNIDELKSNFKKYISTPPQLNENIDSYEYNQIKIPIITNDSFKIEKSYLVLKQTGPLSVMDRNHLFPVIKSDDYETQAKLVHHTF
ncbi:MAG: hypothetical protein E6Y27_02910 [Enterobacter sp.]|uniref:hypothetical protein n=1 Tax=Enterobacter sp. TaxID=42895 RepID=UPI002915046C|nr:hypothetical protein [Enterobacter sp.]MDU4613609.1 hypothetical protein [Enterobacter sp.]